jgi:RNA polymerase sigma factor (sigma-70 family)
MRAALPTRGRAASAAACASFCRGAPVPPAPTAARRATMTFADLPDAELLARCRAGSASAWEVLVRRYQRLIYTVVRRAGMDEHTAADVFQAVFERLNAHLERIDQPERLQAWLVTTARRETLRLLEHERRMARRADDDDTDDPIAVLADESPLPDELLTRLQDEHRVRRALQRLDARSRDLLALLFQQDEPLAYADIAARLGISEGSIGPTRMRALAKLRDLLAADAG